MTNKYMFFNAQQFDNFDLSDYEKNDVSIPKTNIHIYEFKCKEAEETSDDESKAKKLDELTQKLEKDFADQFITVNSGSSQFFCSQLYPLIVEFETNLRYALYISRVLFDNGNVKKESFKLDVNKKQISLEDADFGIIYQSIFTDKDFSEKVKKTVTDVQMTKADYIKKIQSLDENTTWQKWVGKDYSYIELNFLALKDYRNDVMHNHLINFETYQKAKETISSAIDTLNCAIKDKLIVNESEYLNTTNILDTLSSTILNMFAYFEKNNVFKLIQESALPTVISAFSDITPIQSSLMESIKNISDTSMMFDNYLAQLSSNIVLSSSFQDFDQENNVTNITLPRNET